MKALKIDVATKKVTQVEIQDYKEIYKHINAELFCCPVQFPNGDVLYADDEGLLKEVVGCFCMPNWNHPIVGNAIILGSTEYGESTDCKTKAEYLQSTILFGNKELVEFYKSVVV